MCSCLRCLCPLSMCLCLLSSVFVPTMHSTTLFLPLSLYFAAIHIFVNSVYARVCVQSLCLCNLYFYQTVPFCPLFAFLPLCVCLSALFSLCPRCLCQIRLVCVHSAAHSRCLCLLSSVFAPTRLLPALCTLGVFVHSISHQDLWTFYFKHVLACGYIF